MRFSLFGAAALLLACATGSSAQSVPEAARFGILTGPSSCVGLNETFQLRYNATTAVRPPIYLDILIQGVSKTTNQPITPYYSMLHFDWPVNTVVYEFKTEFPTLYGDPTGNKGYNNQTNYPIWAFITYPNEDDPENGAPTIGGIAGGPCINFN